ncbi:MAG TPA: hypothetical protein VLM42_02870 [Bryobacteraceae bacterium]|nr:hypothetical protein [Bryobacteraceae bacterium]
MFLKASLVAAMIAMSAFGQQAAPAAAARAPRMALTFPPVFIAEEWTRPANAKGQVPVAASNLSHQNLELKVYGTDAKNLTISGEAGNATGPLNLWTGMCTAPVAATLRDKNNYVDLTGLAKVRWVTRASGFHVVRPVVKLADGTMLVGDHVDASTTTFLESEFAFTGLRWIKLDPERVVTTGVYGPVGEASSWVENPDLSKVDEVGFADLMPGTGHGSGGWVNVARFEVYGKPVKR